MAYPAITSERLDLVVMSSAFLDAALAGDLAQASQIIDMRVPEEWLAQRWLMVLRQEQIRVDPTLEPWLLRAVRLHSSGEMIGHIGFHAKPGAEYLHEYAPDGVEFGYTIFPAFRQHGYAREASAALMEWATRAHGVTAFVLSISPNNVPSLRIAAHFGFAMVGSMIDDQDGPEDVFVRYVAAQ